MNNEINLEVTRVLGESVNGNSKVNICKPAFDAIRQSNWAGFNSRKTGVFEKPELSFTPRLSVGNNWVNEFTFKGVKVLSYSDKENRKTHFFMNTKQAEKLLVTESTFDVSKFDLSVPVTT